jgi:tRNA(Ile)-lysidine synthase
MKSHGDNTKAGNSSRPFLQRIRSVIEKYRMLEDGEKVLAAVSGGPDSVCLLLVLRELGMSVAAAHLNHGLRGEESDGDETFVRSLCDGIGIPVISEKADAARFAEENRLSLEDACRRLRYRFLEKARCEAGAAKIATGHTRNDVAESVLLGLLRGSGTHGLSGLTPVLHGKIIRPLIEMRREEILGFLNERGASYRIDSSNADVSFLRNRIRHELIEELRKSYNPGIVEMLARSSLILREENEFLDSLAEESLGGLLTPHDEAGNSGLRISASRLAGLHPVIQRRCLRLAVRKLKGDIADFKFRHFEDLCRLAAEGGRRRELSFPSGLVAVIEQGEIVLKKRQEPEPLRAYLYPLPVPGACVIAEARFEVECRLISRSLVAELRSSGNKVHLDAGKAGQGLEIRNRRPGDRFRPFGSPGTKKLKDYFMDRKVPFDRRGTLPLLVVGDRILWVFGYQIEESFRLGNSSEVLETTCREVM